jgi:hypothetical protein
MKSITQKIVEHARGYFDLPKRTPYGHGPQVKRARSPHRSDAARTLRKCAISSRPMSKGQSLFSDRAIVKRRHGKARGWEIVGAA